jgi:Protein of unknown function (DUF3089)
MNSRTVKPKTLESRPEIGTRWIRRAIVVVTLATIALILPSGADAFVYWANGTAISRANLDGTGVNQSFIGGTNGSCGVAVDGSHVYWGNFANHSGTTIGRANLDGTHVDQSFIGGANGPCGVAVDGSHLYWANVDGGTIGRANLDGTGVNQSFIGGGSGPCGVAVDAGHVYWANVASGAIARANLNGTAANQSFIGGANGPCGVAVNSAHLYWANLSGTTIGRANLDGSGANQSFITGASGPCGVAVNSAHLFWANVDGGTIGRANLDASGANQSFITGASAPCWVAVDSLTSTYQPDGLIKRSTEASFIGDGVYSTTAAGETRSFQAKRGQTRAFYMRLQNDGRTADAIDAKGCGSSQGFTVSYQSGSTDVTQRVTSGTYSTGTLAPGATRALTLRIKVGSHASPGARKPCLLRAISQADPTQRDGVKARVTVPSPWADWLCRPGQKPDPCASDRTATVVSGTGGTSVEHAPANKPPIDCFYVYPTVSTQPTSNANLNVDPEERAIAIRQASRFSQRCRVFAPTYRQGTFQTLLAATQNPDSVSPGVLKTAYSGVLRAWRTYLDRYNHGRGVVLIGHSQGALGLIKLIQDQIDGHQAVQKRLVSALLLGANVKVKKGSDVGGSFEHIRACHSSTQTGCVVAYSSFDQPPPADSVFGRVGGPLDSVLPFPWNGGTGPNRSVLCVNPAALGGGVGALTPYFSTTPFPGPLASGYDAYDTPPSAPTPWVKYPHLYTAHCEHANGASWLQIDDIGAQGDSRSRVELSPLGQSWGLHNFDVNLALGNLVGLVRSQTNAYLSQGAR